MPPSIPHKYVAYVGADASLCAWLEAKLRRRHSAAPESAKGTGGCIVGVAAVAAAEMASVAS